MTSNSWSLDSSGAFPHQATGNDSRIVCPAELQAKDEKQTTGLLVVNKLAGVQPSLVLKAADSLCRSNSSGQSKFQWVTACGLACQVNTCTVRVPFLSTVRSPLRRRDSDMVCCTMVHMDSPATGTALLRSIVPTR